MRVLLCPDKFKGSLTADEVCGSMERGIHRYDSSIEVVKLPLADGGEGTLDVLEETLSLARAELVVNDPLFRPVSTYYLRNETQAFIEMARASGLQLLKEEERKPLLTSTFGTGELIKHALDQGVEEIYLLIGGSATNDGGIGMAAALGYQFESDKVGDFQPNGAGLSGIKKVLENDIHPRISSTRFVVLSDVQNPLLSENGAAQVYGPQKGADRQSVELLDNGLKVLTEVLNNGYEHIPGAGAAGGLGYGAMSFLNAQIKPGIQTMMEITGFKDLLGEVDLILTGEGKLDAQTAAGKVISGVIEVVQNKNIPIGIICGVSETYLEGPLVFEVSKVAKDHNDAMFNAAEYVSELAFRMISTFQ